MWINGAHVFAIATAGAYFEVTEFVAQERDFHGARRLPLAASFRPSSCAGLHLLDKDTIVVMDTPADPSLTDVIAKSVEVLTKFSIPLYQNDKGRPSLHGTGFFVSVDGNHFLISAAHVLDTAMTRGLYLPFVSDHDSPPKWSGSQIGFTQVPRQRPNRYWRIKVERRSGTALSGCRQVFYEH